MSTMNFADEVVDPGTIDEAAAGERRARRPTAS